MGSPVVLVASWKGTVVVGAVAAPAAMGMVRLALMGMLEARVGRAARLAWAVGLAAKAVIITARPPSARAALLVGAAAVAARSIHPMGLVLTVVPELLAGS